MFLRLPQISACCGGKGGLLYGSSLQAFHKPPEVNYVEPWRGNLYWTDHVGPYQRGFKWKDLRDLTDLTLHDVKPMSDE